MLPEDKLFNSNLLSSFPDSRPSANNPGSRKTSLNDGEDTE